MKQSIRTTKWIAATLIYFAATSATLAVDTAIDSARKAVETYARVESGESSMEDRQSIIKFSPKVEADLKLNRDMHVHVFIIGVEPLVVVSKYTVSDVKVNGKKATAIVVYQRLARSEGNTVKTWHIVAEPPHEETVTLNLVFDKSQWWVLDPPPPRVSKWVLINYYEELTKEAAVNSARWLRATKTLAALKALSNR